MRTVILTLAFILLLVYVALFAAPLPTAHLNGGGLSTGAAAR
jgi:hypothetical protein